MRKLSAAACGGAIGADKFGGIVGMFGTVCGTPEAAVWAPLTFMSLVADRGTRKVSDISACAAGNAQENAEDRQDSDLRI